MTMLRLSKMADYGIVVMTAMIRDPERSRSAAEIAATIHVPVPTVTKLLKILARGGLLVSLRGAKGGYLLAHPADQISLADIIHVMDGPIGMTECSVTPGLCTQEANCAVRANWQRINNVVFDVLNKIALDQMIAPVPKRVGVSEIKFKRVSKPSPATPKRA
jgi:FeS assembly SUF system regulator